MAAALHKMERRNDAAGEQYNDQTLLHLIPVNPCMPKCRQGMPASIDGPMNFWTTVKRCLL
jgi:hypothetical protein